MKGAFAPDGYAYAWDDSEVSIRRAMQKIGMGSAQEEAAETVKEGWVKQI